MTSLDGRVAIVTGAGRGLGREHALLMAAEGAMVVVNDLGGASDGSGTDAGPAQQVVDEITAAGGQAVANTDDVADLDGAGAMVAQAIDTFGGLDILVNNAGILRDATLVKMTGDEWDAISHVHLRGHFAPTHHAAKYWRGRSKAGDSVQASVINTSSGAGLFGNFGQTNYSAAKAGIAAFTITAAIELAGYGVKVNAIAPVARTRLTLQTPGIGELVNAPDEGFDAWGPHNVAPLVAYLATADHPFNGGVFHVGGNEVALARGWTVGDVLTSPDGGTWSVDDLAKEAGRMLEGREDQALASAGSSLEEVMGGFAIRNMANPPTG